MEYFIDKFSDHFTSRFVNTFDTGSTSGSVACGFSIYTDGVRTFKVKFVEDAQLPVIVSLDGDYVDNGQQLKLNSSPTVLVGWYPTTGIYTEEAVAVSAHEFATDVTITLDTAQATFSHKTGVADVDLLYYRTDSNEVVYFDMDYTIPLTVTSPVTFGYSLTNGNVSGAVILEFSQALLENKKNTVTIPAFTDDWGNSVALVDRQTELIYGELLNPVLDAVENYSFGAPRVSDGSIITTRYLDGYTYTVSVTDAVGTGNIFTETTDITKQPIQLKSALGGNGVSKKNLDTNPDVRFNRTNKATDPYYVLNEFSIVFEMSQQQGVYNKSFQYEVFSINRVCDVIIVANKTAETNFRFRIKPYNLAQKDTPSTITVHAANSLSTGILTYNIATGVVNFYDNLGNTLNFTSFVRDLTIVDPTYLFNRFDTSRDFKGVIHRYYTLPYIVDAEQRALIFEQTAIDYGAQIPAEGGNTRTADLFPKRTADTFSVDTNF